MIVGLRGTSVPNEFEALILAEYIKDHYGNHTIEELKLAFKKAVAGELSIESKDVKHYENFSVLYVSAIMNSYRKWAGEQFFRLENFIDPQPESPLLLEAPKIHWGSIIEKEYQHFVLFGHEHFKIWPVGFYEQMAEDKFFDANAYVDLMAGARSKIIGELKAEKEKLTIRRFPSEGENVTYMNSIAVNWKDEGSTMDIERKRSTFTYNPNDPANAQTESLKQQHLTKIKDLETAVQSYESGERDAEIIIRAKQHVVLMVFRKAKNQGRKNLYQPV